MPRLVLAIAAALLAAPSARPADPTPETLIRLTVQPMAAPKPALRYLLLPELREMSPGNPIPNYLKALLALQSAEGEEVFSLSALKQVDRAARMDQPDWQILPELKTDGISLLLPDVQKMRALANGLQSRFRDEIALRRFDDALVTAKTMFAMSRHMGEHPTLIGDLVAIAIAQVAIAPLEDLLGQPGCPNLYWALTNLPHPFISLDKGMQGERMFVAAELRDLNSERPMTKEQLAKVVKHIDWILAMEPGKKRHKTQAWLDARTKDEKDVADARRRLVEHGLRAEHLARFPADQVLLLDEQRDYEVRRDEYMKYMSLPTWEAADLLAANEPSKSGSLFDGFLPAVRKVRLAQGRLEQRIALLRRVEALRLYAAANDGKLPSRLADVGVPLPNDPFTGKPFRYEADGATAHVRGTPPKGEEKNVAYNVHYEITIRK